MNHLTCMSLPHKRNVLKTFSDHNKCKSKSSADAETSRNAVCYSSMKPSAQNSSPHKVKRLKTRKERNEIRDQERNRSHTCPQQSRKTSNEKAQHHGCHLKHSIVSYRKAKAFAKPFLPQKPSVITEGRLTSIRGLFSHEIRSLDIERLVSEKIKKDKQREDQRKQYMMHMTSPLPPHPVSMPDLNQDCNEVQKPEKTKKLSRKDLTGKCLNAFQTNKGVTMFMESSRQDKRSAQTSKEDTHNKSSSLKGTYDLIDLSSPENQLAHHQICSTPIEAGKNYFDFSEIDSPKSHNENITTSRTATTEKENGVINIQKFESTFTRAGFPSIKVPQKKSDPSLSELDSGTDTLTDSIKEGEKISASVREAIKRLTAHLELHVPGHPLLEECREELLLALQKTHSFNLQHNLQKLQSLFNFKQTMSFGSRETHKDCSQLHFGHALGNEDCEHRRNIEIWTENAIQQKYTTEEVKQNADRGASMKKQRVHSMMTFSPSSLMNQLQSHTDMIDQSLQFDQSKISRLSQDCFRGQDYPRAALFGQDQAFSQLAAPIPSTPTWTIQPFKPCSQGLLGDLPKRDEGMKNVGLDLISHQWDKNTDPMFNLYHKYQNRKEKAQETFLGESSFWSNQLQVQDVRERWAPLSFSASLPSEGFQYKPFFRFSHLSKSQHSSDLLGMTLGARSNSPLGMILLD